jgi:RND family efflux transporter MFP subunit
MTANRLVVRGGAALALGAAAVGTASWLLQGGVKAAEPPPGIAATRGTLVVAVGGVGRIVESKAVETVTLPGSGGTATVPGSADAIFPRTTGHLAGFLVVQGQRVTASQPLAKIDDGGAAAAAIRLAKDDLAVAELELRQKQASNLTLGPVPTEAELAAGRAAVYAARAKLARLLARPRAADVDAARLEVRRAEADLETLLGGPPRARAEAIRIARENLAVAKRRLKRTLTPASAADVSAGRVELRKAEAELATLRKAPQPVAPETLVAANQAVTAAQQKLAKVTGPRDPLATLTADAELARAEADLAALQRAKNPPTPVEEIQAAQAAVDAARLKREQTKAPPDPADVAAAQQELDKAVAELATLQRPAPAPLPAQIEAAEAAVESARLKLARLQRGPDPADVAAARLEVDRARAELRARRSPASAAALAAARQTVRTAKAKLALLLGPPLAADVVAARFDLRRAEADLEVLHARLRPSATDVGLAELKVDAARAALARAQAAKKWLIVRAPRAGRVTALLTVAGAPVDSSTPIAALANLEDLAVNVDLSEFDVAQVKPGLKATVNVDALGGRTFPGKVEFAALTGSNASGVVTFPVRVGLERTAGLRPGMNVSVRIVVARRSDVVQVPLEAVLRDDEDHPFVNVLSPTGETTEREVKLGLANNRNVEIVEGLRAGERVEVAESEPQEEA